MDSIVQLLRHRPSKLSIYEYIYVTKVKEMVTYRYKESNNYHNHDYNGTRELKQNAKKVTVEFVAR